MLARASFTEALRQLNQASANQITALLQNLANAYLQLQRPAEAVMHAAAVLALFPDDKHPKACYLAAKASLALGNEHATKWLLSRVPTLSKTPALSELAATVGAKPGTNLRRQLHEDHDLVYALVHASLQLPDPAPGSNVFRSLAASLDPLQHTACCATAHTPAAPCAEPATDTERHAGLKRQIQAAAAFKLEGNALFEGRDFVGAVRRWSAALDALDMLPGLVKDLVDVQIKKLQGQVPPERLAILAAIALLWAPRETGFHIMRTIHAGEVMAICGPPGSHPLSMKVLCTEQGLRLSPDDPQLLALHQELTEMLEKVSASAALYNAGKSIAQQAIEAEMQGRLDQSTGIAMMETTRRMMESRAAMTAAAAKVVGPMPGPFDELYRDAGLLPAGCDARKCLEHLAGGAKDAYWSWTTLAQPLLVAGSATHPGPSRGGRRPAGIPRMDPLGGQDNPVVSPGTLSVRLAGEADGRRFWWRHAPIGSIAFRLLASCSYHDGNEKVQSFCNVQQHGLPLHTGLTGRHVHVAVGFVDLGEVAETVIEDGRRGGQRELQWHGFEASGHACALTLVITQMLRADAPVDSVVQVTRLSCGCGRLLRCVPCRLSCKSFRQQT